MHNDMFSPPSDQTVYMQNSGPFRLKIGTVYENFNTDNGKEMLWAINI